MVLLLMTLDKLIKNQEGNCVMGAAIVDQAAAAITAIEVPTIRRTLCLKKKGGGKHHAQGWCLYGGCTKQTTVYLQRVHALYRWITEAVSVLQPHYGGGEQVLSQAHCLSLRARKRWWGQLGQSGDTPTMTIVTGKTTACRDYNDYMIHNKHIICLIVSYSPCVAEATRWHVHRCDVWWIGGHVLTSARAWTIMQPRGVAISTTNMDETFNLVPWAT